MLIFNAIPTREPASTQGMMAGVDRLILESLLSDAVMLLSFVSKFVGTVPEYMQKVINLIHASRKVLLPALF